MNEEELNTLQYEVGKAMRDNPLFRTHKGREALIDFIKAKGIKCSTESVSRAQRKLWEIALNELDVGNYSYAFKLLPGNKNDFEDWLIKRKVSQDTYRKYYGAFNNYNKHSFICRVCNVLVESNRNPIIHNNICLECKKKIYKGE